ncbi:MAG: 2TM domain-containing protein [Spirochaetaceae bacterium]|nr:2TM domain-containing protein [Spirochaetaceae bacterium]
MGRQPSVPEERSAANASPRQRLARFVQRCRERADNAKSALTVHGVTYAAVNLGLLLINLLTSPGFLWFLFPVAAWGIGLLQHFTEGRVREREARDAATLPPLTKRALARVRRLFKVRRRLRHHLSTVAGLSAFLVGLNAFFPAEGPWAIFPILALGIPLAIHNAVARSRRKRLHRELAEEGMDIEAASADLAALAVDAPEALFADAPLLAEAAELREAILADLQDGGADADRWRTELQPELDTYTRQIGELLQTRHELERAGARVSAAEITEQLAVLNGKLDAATSAELRREYQTAVEQYEGQAKSLRDLQERIEMIDLRAKSAVLALRQLSLDIPRLRTAPAGEPAGLASLRDKSQELTRYLDDLRAGHRELDAAAMRVR